jgi:3-oxoacyl-[acyl-carrier protein] reductase
VARLDGKIILVTGAGRGLGRAMMRRFIEDGATVVAAARDLGRLEQVTAEFGDKAMAAKVDVGDAADVEAMFAAVDRRFGRLDVLVNNAANMYRQAVDQYTEQFLAEAFNTNVISAMMLSSLAVPHLEKTKGAIVFLGSIHNRRAYPGASPYATTKAAIEGLTRVMAAELGRRQIRCGCILPGAVPTEINLRAKLFTPEQSEARYAAIAPDHALGRVGTGSESAEAIEFLARAEWVTGVALEVDGGLGLGVSNF